MNQIAPIILDDRSARFVEAQLSQGKYPDADSLVRDALALLQQQQSAREGLRLALAEGEASGDFQPFDYHDFLAWKAANFEK